LYTKRITKVSRERLKHGVSKDKSRRREMSRITPMAEKEKPVFRDALIMGLIAVAIGVFLILEYSWDMIASATYWILKSTGVDVTYTRPLMLISLSLRDGTLVGFQVLMECSGIVTVGVFAAISTFTVGLLKGSILRKIGWFLLSIGLGLMWNINRVILAIFMAYNFGISAFSLVHYLLAPSIDFIWIVSLWALGMSLIKRRRMETL